MVEETSAEPIFSNISTTFKWTYSDYAPNWDTGVVRALMAGSVLEVVEANNVIASFPLAGSSRAIGALRASCS